MSRRVSFRHENTWLICKSWCKLHRDQPVPSPHTRNAGVKQPEEIVIHIFGPFGRWQVMIYVVLFSFLVFHGMSLFVPSYFAPDGFDHYCNRSRATNYTCEGHRCQKYDWAPANNWKLFCTHDVDSRIYDVVFRAGLVVGFIVNGFLADRLVRFGRRMGLMFAIFVHCLAGLLDFRYTHLMVFHVANFVIGFCLSGSSLLVIVLGCEFTSNRWRTVVVGAISVGLPVGVMLGNFTWYYTSDRIRLLIGSAPQFVLFIIFWYIPENPSSCLMELDVLKAERNLKKLAKINRLTLPEDFHIRPVLIYSSQEYSRSLRKLLAYTPSRRVVISLTCIWLALGYFFGLALIESWACKKDFLLAAVLISVTCLVATILSIGIYRLFNHRRVMMVTIMLAVIPSVIVEYNSDCKTWMRSETKQFLEHTRIFLYSVALFGAWNATPRMIPFGIRCRITGWCLLCCQAGLMISHSTHRIIIPLYFVIPLSIFIVLICYFLFLVNGRELPDTMEDIKNFSKYYKPLRWDVLKHRASVTSDEIEVNFLQWNRNDTSFM